MVVRGACGIERNHERVVVRGVPVLILHSDEVNACLQLPQNQKVVAFTAVGVLSDQLAVLSGKRSPQVARSRGRGLYPQPPGLRQLDAEVVHVVAVRQPGEGSGGGDHRGGCLGRAAVVRAPWAETGDLVCS